MEKTQDLAYWLGVLHSDGKRVCYTVKKNGKSSLRWELALEVAPKSLPMLEKFRRIFEFKFGRKLKIHRLSNGNYKIGTSIKKLIGELKALGINFRGTSIPSWVAENPKFFGAYLAGRIDGDGDIRVKGYKRRTPQCAVRIHDGNPQVELKHIIQKQLRCRASITRRRRVSILKGRKIQGTCYSLEFVVSKKNIEFIARYLVPHLVISHKKQKLAGYVEFFRNRYSSLFFVE